MTLRFAAAVLLSATFGITTACTTPEAPASDAAGATAHDVNIHLTAAQEAAGTDYPGLLARVCIVPPTGRDAASGVRRADGVNGLTPVETGPRVENVPPREEWYQEPRQIFDNLYWVGSRRNNSWVLRTTDGLIVIDTLSHFAVEAEIVDGIRKLGMDPADVKYTLIAHGHGDHSGGAKILQDLGSRVVMGGPDWDLVLNGTPMFGGNPTRDIEGTDGHQITLGDTTVTMYLTPGHTDGTLSFLFPVQDGDQTRMVAYSGGTAYNFPRSVERFQQYADTQRRFAQLAADANATVLLSNHSEFDSGYMKARMIATRMSGEQNPFLVEDGVQRYHTVLIECAEAEKARLMIGEDAPSMEM